MTIAEAKELLEANGYTVLKTKSYNAARERLRVAESLKRYADEDRERAWVWVRDQSERQRGLSDRCAFLYGEAKARGATQKELSGHI